MSNLILQPGDADPADLISEAGDGLYVKMIGHGMYHPETGRFSFDVREGYRIQQGRLTHPVCDLRVEGHSLKALRQIAGTGHDLKLDADRGLCEKKGQIVPVSVGTPTVLLHDLEVHT